MSQRAAVHRLILDKKIPVIFLVPCPGCYPRPQRITKRLLTTQGAAPDQNAASPAHKRALDVLGKLTSLKTELIMPFLTQIVQ